VFYSSAWTCKSQLPRYVVNGDGTLTDNQTGMMWEIETTTCSGEVTCYTTSYLWTSSGTAADGTLFTIFLAGLNGGDYFSPSVGQDVSNGPSSCFANHCDWRIPTVAELQTIYYSVACATSGVACINPSFGPTENYYYWSFSTLASAGGSNGAYAIDFGGGGVQGYGKNQSIYARAVRTSH
jgi:hypothetical protein